MAKIVGILVLTFTLLAGFAKPASAEFFGCDDPHATPYSRGLTNIRSYTRDFAAQRSRHSSRRVSHSWSDRYR